MAEGYLKVTMPIAQDDLFQGMLSTFNLPKDELIPFRKAFDEERTYDFRDQSFQTGTTTVRLKGVPWYRIS